jgi:hypothetical protein
MVAHPDSEEALRCLVVYKTVHNPSYGGKKVDFSKCERACGTTKESSAIKMLDELGT